MTERRHIIQQYFLCLLTICALENDRLQMWDMHLLSKPLKGKDHKNKFEVGFKVLAMLNILKQTAKNRIFTFEDIAILCFQNGSQWRPPF